MMDAATWILFQEARNWTLRAEFLKQFDFGVGKVYKGSVNAVFLLSLQAQ